MMIKTAVRLWHAAHATRPGHLIDKFLDWIEDLSVTMLPARVEGLVRIEIRTESRRDH
jgi:hypothetical protein